MPRSRYATRTSWFLKIAIGLVVLGLGLMITKISDDLGMVALAFGVATALLYFLFAARPLKHFKGDPTKAGRLFSHLQNSEEAEWEEMRVRRAARRRKREAERQTPDERS